MAIRVCLLSALVGAVLFSPFGELQAGASMGLFVGLGPAIGYRLGGPGPATSSTAQDIMTLMLMVLAVLSLFALIGAVHYFGVA